MVLWGLHIYDVGGGGGGRVIIFLWGMGMGMGGHSFSIRGCFSIW